MTDFVEGTAQIRTDRDRLDEDDHDLLTFVEAGERLRIEIASVQCQLEQCRRLGTRKRLIRRRGVWMRYAQPLNATPRNPSTTRTSRNSSATRVRRGGMRPLAMNRANTSQRRELTPLGRRAGYGFGSFDYGRRAVRTRELIKAAA